MAGHSHWAGIKHKKGRADKQRSKLFSKLSREITVAARLGDKNPEMNSRLRSAIFSARTANMPKDNIDRAIDKSEQSTETNFEQIRYEGFGPNKIAVIIESLTNNKNRSASNLRTIFQKNGGNLGAQGSASHNFTQKGVIKIDRRETDEIKILDIAVECGADDCLTFDEYYQILCEKSKVYEIQKKIEQKILNFISINIDWIPNNYIEILNDDKSSIVKFLNLLDDEDDVQNVFTNAKFLD